MRVVALLAFFALMPATTTLASAQGTFQAWMESRAKVAARELSTLNLAAEQMDRDKDVEPPSISAATSLVDQTDAPDLIALGMSLYDAVDSDTSSTPVVVTVSGWALKNAVTQENPLDPAVYSRGGNWRRWSMSVGRELESGAAEAARVFGGKFLIINHRDVSAHVHNQRFEELDEALMATATNVAAVQNAVFSFLFATLRERVSPPLADDQRTAFITTHLADRTFAGTLKLLTPDESRQLDQTLAPIVDIDAKLSDVVQRAVKAIRGAPQLAVTYQARLRGDTAPDDHRWEAAFDFGPTDRLTVAVNGSFDLKQLEEVESERSGRLAAEFGFVIGRRESVEQRARQIFSLRRTLDKSPIVASVATEFEWRVDKRDTKRIQGKVTIPIPALKGISLPVSVTWANDPELIDENDVRGQVGFTLDFSQLKSALTALVQ